MLSFKLLTPIHFTLVLLFFSSSLFSQDTLINLQNNTAIQQQLENITESVQSEDVDFSSLLETLSNNNKRPINLNNTNKEALQTLKLLTDAQINNLLQYIKQNGKLIAIFELQAIDGFDLKTITAILPFVKINEERIPVIFNKHDFVKNSKSTLTFRYAQVLEKQLGFTAIDSLSLYKNSNARYIGSPLKLYVAYRFSDNEHIRFGITAEKDQGELFLKSKQQFKYDWYEQSLKNNQKNGFDFYSAHLFVSNLKFIKALAIGDYQATFGQGLVLWNGFSFGKSLSTLYIRKSSGGIQPYTSVNENNFLRGAATTIAIKKIEITVFYSRKRIDAQFADTLTGNQDKVVSSLKQTGYHSTLNEIATKNALFENCYGGNVSYNTTNFHLGFTGLNYELEYPLKRNLTYYNQFEFSSKSNFNGSVDYHFNLHNFNFFGEAAKSKVGGMGFLNGMLVSMDTRLSLVILHRYYQRNYQAIFSNGFSERSNNANEKGLYTGLTINPISTIALNAYYDRFEFPWLTYQANAPAYGNEYSAQINYTPTKNFNFYFQIKQRNLQKNTKENVVIDHLVAVKQTNYRFNISYRILDAIQLKNRIEISNYRFDGRAMQNGFLIYQEVSYHKISNPLSITLRYSIFDTDDYDTRLYAYESDMPGTYSIPSYFNRGSRFYILLNYNINRHIELWVRYSQTYYDNKNVISEGTLNEIRGNTKSEVKAQVQFKF
ncbi:MAG: helix-hairpin-helix domain-containing protein [Bacteroidia bacterium]